MPSADLRFLISTGAGLELICLNGTCRHVKGYGPSRPDVDPDRTVLGLALRFGERTTLEQLARKVVCPKCGSKNFRLEPWDESARR